MKKLTSILILLSMPLHAYAYSWQTYNDSRMGGASAVTIGGIILGIPLIINLVRLAYLHLSGKDTNSGEGFLIPLFIIAVIAALILI